MSTLLKFIVLGIGFTIFAISPQVVIAQDEVASKETKAVKSAMTWLKLVDEKSYSESWQKAAKFFKESVSESDWYTLIVKIRKPMGQLSSRELLGKKYLTSLPNAPKGEYVVIQYKAVFEGDEKAFIETITPMKDKDGHWRVSGYYIYEMPLVE